jgi:hypothetical protein
VGGCAAVTVRLVHVSTRRYIRRSGKRRRHKGRTGEENDRMEFADATGRPTSAECASLAAGGDTFA